MGTHEQLVKKLMRRPGVLDEVERIERDETFEASPEVEAMLVVALEEAGRGETIPVSQVLELLRKR